LYGRSMPTKDEHRQRLSPVPSHSFSNNAEREFRTHGESFISADTCPCN
jgi:hypothetical protein